jgi:hypothetical protein
VDPAIRDFYEHTAAYRLEAWSEAGLPTRLFLWALTRFVSRRMDQLNFPVSSLELAGGMTNRVLPMVDAAGRRAYTGWLRQLAADGRVGLYVRGWPLTRRGPWPVGQTCHVHELAGGLIECDCERWPLARSCEHTKLLIADGLVEEPIGLDDQYQGGLAFPDELVDIDIDSPDC